VPAYADAALGSQSPFALSASALVLKQRDDPFFVDMSEQDVRNELLKLRIFFHFAPRPIGQLVALPKRRQISVELGRESLEVPQSMEMTSGNDEHSLIGDGRHGDSFQWTGSAAIDISAIISG
jgi:hypothetical protein